MLLLKISKKYNFFLTNLFGLYNLINYLLLKYKISINYYFYTNDVILNVINKERRKGDLLLTVNESLQLYESAKSALKIKGDFAEVGVYKGGSALIIAEVKRKRKLYLFDTFDGLPKAGKVDKYIETGAMKGVLEAVQNKLKKYSGIYFFKGLFPQTAMGIRNKRFAFVHFDVDLYRSTKDCLNFFYPRMSQGGVILTHDYPFLTGVKRAFDEFFSDKDECVIKMVGNQGLVIKT